MESWSLTLTRTARGCVRDCVCVPLEGAEAAAADDEQAGAGVLSGAAQRLRAPSTATVAAATPRRSQTSLALTSRFRAFSACAARTASIIDAAPYTADPARTPVSSHTPTVEKAEHWLPRLD